jgi:hypothetical protein
VSGGGPATTPVAARAPKRVVSIRVVRGYESCERTSYFVELKTDEGLTMTPTCMRTGSVQLGPDGERVVVPGMSIGEARDRALMEAADWGDFLMIDVEPYFEDGVRHEPSFLQEIYTTQRELAAEEAVEAEARTPR